MNQHKKSMKMSARVWIVFFLLTASCLLPTTAQASLTDGLVGYWTFDGKDTNWGTNKTNDLSGQGNTGTLTNMSTTTSPVVGKIGQGLKFDGTDDYVSSSFATYVSSSPLETVSFWVKATSEQSVKTVYSESGNGGANYFSIGTGPTFSGGCGCNLSSKIEVVIGTGNFGYAIDRNSNGTVFNNAWHHIVWTDDNGTAKLYIDGVVDSVNFNYTPLSNTTVVRTTVGANALNGTLGSFLAGKIDDVRVYNRALSAGEVTQLYKLGAAKLAVSPVNALKTGLVGYWTFDGKDTNWGTNKTNDLSGQGNTGTLTNMSTTTSPAVGKLGQGLKFDGVDDYVAVTGSPSVQNVSYWIKPVANYKYSLGLSGVRRYLLSNGLYSGTTTATRYINGVIPTAESLGSELVTNGTAETGGTSPFGVNVTSPGAMTGSVTTTSPYAGTYSFDFNITNGADASWKVQMFENSSHSVSVGQLYKVQFAAKGSVAKTGLSLAHQRLSSPFDEFGLAYTFDLTTEWVLHTTYFYVKTTMSDGALYWNLGNQGAYHFYVDNISIKKVNSVGDVTNNAWNFVSVNLDSAVSADAINLGRASPIYFNGVLDDVRVYNRALSAGEVGQLYKLGAAKLAVSPVNSLKSGLVGYWTFDGKDTNWGTNKTNDLSGQGNTGTLTSMSTTTSPTVGKLGQGLKFDGVNDYVNAGSGSSVNVTGAITACFWVKTSSSGMSGVMGNRGGSGNGGYVITLRGEEGGGVNYRIGFTYFGVLDWYSSNNAYIANNQWQHLCVVNPATGNIRFYANGAQHSTAASANSGTSSDQPLYVGAWNNSGTPANYFNGSIDDIRIYNRALSAGEVQQLYKLGASKSR